jgi:NitT/TauT family transport system ATP-binding protein
VHASVEYLPQDYNDVLFPWKNVAWNIALPALIRDPATSPIHAATSALRGLPLLDEFEGFWQSYPGQLSGGARHLVAIARAFACRAQILLLDEPFTGLDFHRFNLVARTLSAYAGLVPSSLIILVTHQVPEHMPPHLLFRTPAKPLSTLISLQED